MLLPKQLSYRRSINPSACLFYWQDETKQEHPVLIESTTVLGLKDGWSEAYNDHGDIKSAIVRQDLAYGNPHTVERCYLDPRAKKIILRFSLYVEAAAIAPHVCDNEEVCELLIAFIQAYSRRRGWRELAKRYVDNLIFGTWLWRNQLGMGTQIIISPVGGRSVLIPSVQERRWSRDTKGVKREVDELISQFERGLGEPGYRCTWTVEAELYEVLLCQELYPSQVFPEEPSRGKGKQLQSRETPEGRQAILSSQKIGAAIQTIDDWYGEDVVPLRVGAYGVDKRALTVKRPPHSQLDLYSLLTQLETWVKKLNSPKVKIPDQVHFIVANLVKGGLFQGGGK